MFSLYIEETPGKGRGVFTADPIPAETEIELCPVLIIPETQVAHIDRTVLYDYYFCWGENQKDAAIALGFGSIYNHSFSPNAEYRVFEEERIIGFYALRDIEPGEEICVNYNGDPLSRVQLWFQK